MRTAHIALAFLLSTFLSGAVYAQDVPSGLPQATIDLRTAEGARSVNGAWRYSNTRIIEREHRAPDTDGQPTGAVIQTYDYTPHAGGSDFDDSKWEVIDPTSLETRRSTGRLCFNWYRINIMIPEKVGDFYTNGSTVVFQTVVDDYAEIWVDGELSRGIGQRGGSVVAGWNAPNRLVIGRNVKPGQKIQLAVFGANGPLSDPPANFIWMREAKLEFYKTEKRGPFAITPQEVNVEIERLDPALDSIVPANPKLFKLAEGFQFTEGRVWVKDDRLESKGSLLFSDPNANTIYRYTPDSQLSIFREMSGYHGDDIAEYGQPGSNGLTLDKQGRLTIDEHGRHRVTRLEPDGSLTVLADRFGGKRLNSPNDLAYRSDGALYFTDPPYGLPKFFSDPRKELDFSGVYLLKDGKLSVVTKDLGGPNGIAFSPDEKYLYVTNWDERVRESADPAARKKVVMRYAVQPDGTLTDGRILIDMGSASGAEALDGMKVDQAGNLYVSGPGGLWIVSSEGKHLGTIKGPRLAANVAWGDADGKTLYMTARTGLYRMRLNIQGIRP